ncbi:MAG TPA: acyltransferase family protein [Chryseosolibacter sp.]
MQNTDRRHDLDWLRLIAILILLFFHTGMLFNPWTWHIKNAETSWSYAYWMVWLHYWRMPLLLFISGAGTVLALRKRTPTQYAGERFRRLIVPLIFGMFVVVPPQIYYEHIGQYRGYADFYKTVFEFVPYPKGSFSWHHLWFIAYLFFYSLIGLPFLMFLKSSRSAAFKSTIASAMSRPYPMLFIPPMIMLVTQVLLRPYFPEETHALINDWAFFTLYFMFFLAGIFCYSEPGIWEAIGKNRRALSTASLIALFVFYALYGHLRQVIALPWTKQQVETAFDAAAITGSWFWVITIVAWGQHLLNRPHPWLKHFNEGLYPFYILHQTVIIVVGYYICQLPLTMFAKFSAVSLSTLVVCILAYLFLIRPFALTRILFGMKPRTRPKAMGVQLRVADEKQDVAK